MSVLPQIENPDATVEDLLAQTKKSLGGIPNMARVMANSPALLKGWLELNNALGTGVLPAPVRERLSLASAEYNACEYCLSAHSFVASKVAKIDASEVAAAREAKSADPHTDALLRLSDAVARGRGSVDPSVVEEARAAGVTDAEIAEVVGNLALNILTNYFNILADTPNEYPVVTPRPRA